VTGLVIWLTGLPQSGKSTLAGRVAGALGDRACVLDSDEVRDAIVPRHGYGDEGRDQFYETLANLAALIARQDRIAIVPATANLRRFRERARNRAPAFLEVYVTTPAEVCAARDTKGLYRDHADQLPGVGAPYEPPNRPDVTARGGDDDDALAAILERVTAL
jgi:adenylylsulfate kinase